MDLGPVFPMLKPAGWPGARANLVRPLVPGLKLPGQPLVAFNYPSSDLRPFVGPPRLQKLGQTAEQLIEEALHNLSRNQPVCSLTTINLPGGGTLEVASGPQDPFAVERILHGAFMRYLQAEVFKVEFLAVGIPGRPFLFAAPLEKALSGELLEVTRWTHGKLADDSDDKLSPEVWVLADGQLVGRVTVEAGRPTVDMIV
jgi:hypothetical protein